MRKRSVFRLDFSPARRVAAPDVEGSIYLDTLSYAVQEAVFRMTRPEDLRTTYREIVPGLAVFDLISSTQPLPKPTPDEARQEAVEQHRLIRVQFVRDTPSGISEFAMPLLQPEKDR